MSTAHARTRSLFASLAALLCLFCSGCLVFERQVIVAAVTPDGNEVRTLFVYEDLHVSESNQNLDKARKNSASS